MIVKKQVILFVNLVFVSAIDLESKEFWHQGIKEFETILKEAKELFQ